MIFSITCSPAVTTLTSLQSCKMSILLHCAAKPSNQILSTPVITRSSHHHHLNHIPSSSSSSPYSPFGTITQRLTWSRKVVGEVMARGGDELLGVDLNSFVSLVNTFFLLMQTPVQCNKVNRCPARYNPRAKANKVLYFVKL